MSRYEAMISYVPLDYHTSNIYKAILSVEGEEFDLLRLNVEDLKAQFFLDAATWGLQFWEKEYGLKVSPELSYEERRSRVKAKKRGIGKVGSNFVELVAGAFNNDQADVRFDGKVNIELTRKTTDTLNLLNLQEAVEEIIPAHLNYQIGVKYEALTAIKGEMLQNIPTELVYCGEIKVGAYPEENAAKEYQPETRLSVLYSTAEQVYLLCGTFMCGDRTEFTNNTANFQAGVQIISSYAVTQQQYRYCGEIVCGEVYT